MTPSHGGTEEDFTGTGGLRIHMRSWLPDGAAQAVLLIVPGFNAHSGQYGGPATGFAAAGFATYAVDLRGRGKSEGARFFVTSFDEYLTDVDGMAAIARQRHPGLPVFLLGHSAGGVIATSYAIRHQDALAGLICESFAYRVPAPDLLLALVRAIGNYLPRLSLLKLNNRDFSRDPAAVAALMADPLIADEKQPLLTVAEMSRANERLTTGFASLRLPLLIVHGSADKVTLAPGSTAFHAAAGSADKTLTIYPDHAHDLLADLGKEQVLADMTGWMKARLAPA